MRKLCRDAVMLLVASFFFALIHSCSMDNGVLRPACMVFEVDLDEKWWYPRENPAQPAIYFKANGILKVEGKTDNLSFTLENCNKIRVFDQVVGDSELWVIKKLTADALSIQYPSKELVEYSRKK